MSAALTRKLKQAQQRLQSNDVAGAQLLCEEVLGQAPRNPDALYLMALTHLAAGRIRDGVPLLNQVLAGAPRHGAALENLGVAHLMLGEFADAERALRLAAALPQAPASVYMRLGASLINQQRYAEAIQELERALARAPDDADTHLNLGQARAHMGDADAAEQHFKTVLREEPGHIEAMFNMGVVELGRDRPDDARHWFERVIAQSPAYADAHVNLGIALQRQQRLDESLRCFTRALELNPALALASTNLAETLARQGKLEHARLRYIETLRLAPGLPAALEGLANVCLALGRYKEAIVHLRELLRAEPDNILVLAPLSDALFQDGQVEAAESAAQYANTLDPTAVAPYTVLANVHYVRGELDLMISVLDAGYSFTRANSLLGMLTYELRRVCDWEKWRSAWERLRGVLEQGGETFGGPFALLCEPVSARQQRAYATRWSLQYRKPAPGSGAAAAPAPRPRVRVGYLSSDFYSHATAYLLAEVLELHDRERFEVYAYSYGPEDHGATRSRLRAACEHFVDIARDPDDIATQRIRDDELDVLVDLKGYTLGARPTLLAMRPCRVQVSWLGYPGTMGADFIDYVIADSFLIPQGNEDVYSERVLRMPHCYQPNDRQRIVAAPLVREQYGLPPEGFVFCCFNQAFKITPEVFECWMRLLHATPGSTLWLLEDNRWATGNLLRVALEMGISADRVLFAPRLPLAEHLARYRVADLALDTFPYTSHTTASDALWSGCLLVALCGETFAARVSGSILTHAGVPELVTHTLADYAALARRLATDREYASGLRARLVAARASSSLFDSAGFTRDLERIYLGLVAQTDTAQSRDGRRPR